jgi:4-amino-4-deoxy-L-arabinose transferase-like glycosyltransferase
MIFAWILVAIAFGARLGVVLWLSDTVPYTDFVLYHAAGAEIANDPSFLVDATVVRDFPQINWWPPGYPIFLSFIYSLTGADHRAAVLVQVLLGTVVCWLVYRIGVRAAGEPVGRVAGMAIALNPTYVFLTNQLASENVFLVWMALGLFIAGLEAQGHRSRLWNGIVFGLAALTRAIGLLLPLVVGLWLRSRLRSSGAPSRGHASGRQLGWLLLGCAVVIAPWTLRNLVVAGAPALVCFGGGLNFYFGHNPDHIGYRNPSDTPLGTTRDPAAIDAQGYRLGLAYVAERPTHVLTDGARKVGALYAFPDYALHMNSGILIPDTRAHPELETEVQARLQRQRVRDRWLHGPLRVAARTYHVLLLLFGAAGLLFAFRRRAHVDGFAPGWPYEMRLAAWLVVAWTLAHVVFWAQPRFRVPLEIPLALLAALAAVEVVQRLRPRLVGPGGNE